MKSLRAFYKKYPLLFSVIALALTDLVTEIPLDRVFSRFTGLQAAYYLSGLTEQFLCAIVVGVFISEEGILPHAGLTRVKSFKKLWLIWPILVLTVLNGWSLFDGTVRIDTSKPVILLLFVLIALSTGFYEEILCRGLMLSACLEKWGETKRGVYQAVLVSSLVFGLFHLTNLIMGRGTPLEVGAQIIYSAFFGVFTAACFLRLGSIWPAVITHALFDMMGTLEEISVGYVFTRHTINANYTLESAGMTVLIALPLFIWGMIILRKAPVRSIKPIG